MMTSPYSRLTLEDDLIRHQQALDFAAQAETLFALAARAVEEEEYTLAHGLYGQAGEASQQAGDPIGVTRALSGIGNLLARTSQDQGVEIDLWNEMVLTMALAIKDRQSQAETYLAMNRRDVRWNWRQISRLLAFACYDILGPVPPDIDTPKDLSEHHVFYMRRGEHLRDEALARYQAIGDIEAEAHILLAFGECELWAKQYDEARADLARARHLFQEMGAKNRLKQVLLRLMRLAHRTEDYALYRDCHTQALAIASPRNTPEVLTLLLDLSTMAADYYDWPTAREAYQRAAVVTTALNEPQRQCRIYWQWGQMEFKANHRVMGEALCQWSIALVQKYDPDQVGNYQRELKLIRIREIR
jgi:tetratricopeptide (TPR) repeat protein